MMIEEFRLSSPNHPPNVGLPWEAAVCVVISSPFMRSKLIKRHQTLCVSTLGFNPICGLFLSFFFAKFGQFGEMHFYLICHILFISATSDPFVICYNLLLKYSIFIFIM
jgi:hypothetical protein